MKTETASKALLTQVLKGAQPLDIILPKLRARDQSNTLNLKIIKAIREEEAGAWPDATCEQTLLSVALSSPLHNPVQSGSLILSDFSPGFLVKGTALSVCSLVDGKARETTP